ncbi:uncharacterized protein METZ01_LOCUS467149, partial [marine metagenome]
VYAISKLAEYYQSQFNLFFAGQTVLNLVA